MILTLRTDKPEAEVGLYDESGVQRAYHTWQAHRALSSTLLQTVEGFLAEQNVSFTDVKAVVFYEGPGSFTGLRIGASYVNALELPVVNSAGEDWQAAGVSRLTSAEVSGARPHYGAPAHTTLPVK